MVTSAIDTTEWQALVERSSNASYFQTPECYALYASVGFMKPFVFGVHEAGKLMGVMCGYIVAEGGWAKRYFSKRAIVPGGLLLDDTIQEESVQLLLNESIEALSSEAIYIEIRNYADYSQVRMAIESAGFEYSKHLNIQVAINSVEASRNSLNATKQRQLNASERAGVSWEESSSVDDVRAFYLCLNKLYKTKVRKPLFPYAFFEQVLAHENIHLLVVKHENTVIGGMVCAVMPNKCVYEWFVCGDDDTYKKMYPSVMATWAGLALAAKLGIPRFDFMGAGKPDSDYGVREFKSKFGGELVEHGRFLYVCRPRLYAIGKWVMGKMVNN